MAVVKQQVFLEWSDLDWQKNFYVALYSINAASMIFAHNHPSRVVKQSSADEMITQELKKALALVDVQVLDCFIVTGNETRSFIEAGLL